MITFLKFLFEQKEEKHAVVSFVRGNPWHEGHAEVVRTGEAHAKKVGGKFHLIVSHSQDPEKNPLSPEQKIKHGGRAFKSTDISASSPEHPTLLHHLTKLHKQGVKHVTIVGGSDRDTMSEVAKKYNGVEGKHGKYNFKSMNFIQAGAERKESDTGVTGYSASKMRASAKSGDWQAFHAMAPKAMIKKHKDEMYKDVKAAMIKKHKEKYLK